MLEPLATRNYFPVPPPLADVAGRFGDYGCRRLAEAVAMVLEANRELAEEDLLGQEVIRESLALA